MLLIDDVIFTPLFHNPGYSVQIAEANLGEYYFVERTYFPPIFSDKPIQVFYEYWPEDGVAREYKNSTTIESPYDAGRYGIMFSTIEEMVEFLNILEDNKNEK